MAFSKQGAGNGPKTQRTACLHVSVPGRVLPVIHSMEAAVRGHCGPGVMCGFSAMVPTWEGLQGFSSACWCPRQRGKRQDEDEQGKAVQLGGASKVEGCSLLRVLFSSSPWRVCSRQQRHKGHCNLKQP